MARRTAGFPQVNRRSPSDGDGKSRSENLETLADRRRAMHLVTDLRAPLLPEAIARFEARRVQRLAASYVAGRMTLAEVRAELRGAA